MFLRSVFRLAYKRNDLTDFNSDQTSTVDTALTLSVPQDFHGCTQPFFIYAKNIMVHNLTAHNYVGLKDNPNKVYIKLKGIGFTI